MERLRTFIRLTVLVWVLWGAVLLAEAIVRPMPPTNLTVMSAELDLATTTILVNWYDTELELQDALDDSGIAGLSECELRPDFNTSFCELWLVTPTDNEDAYAFDTIGHELYHALKGDFH